jgi:GTP-binding protein
MPAPVSQPQTPSPRLPRVVIVGRPNVGKSSLFNRIIGKRHAVVESRPGVTRDRLYHPATWRDRAFELIDTGGILFGDEDPISYQIRVQAEIALTEADVVLFVVDGEAGLTPGDEELADLLRPLRKPIFVCVNKADHPKRDDWATDFYALGFPNLIPLSAIHNRGIAELLDEVVEALPPATANEEEAPPLTVTILGRPNVGKSSLLNAIVGDERAIVSDVPGTTRDPIDTEIQFGDERILLVDTAGIKRPGKIQGSVEYYMDLRAKRSLRRASVAILVLDGAEGLTAGDLRAARFAAEAGKAMVFAVNKWDLVEPPDGNPRARSKAKKQFTAVFRDDAPEFAWAPLAFVSARCKTGIEPLLQTCLEVHDNASFRATTGALNRVIREAVADVPPSSSGKALKIYYATQVAATPPTFVLFVNDPARVHFSYERYLENRLRDAFPLEGTPIRILFRTSHEKKTRQPGRTHSR